MREIDRMMELRSRVRDEAERRQIDEAMETLDAAFQARIGMVSDFILNGRTGRPDISDVLRCMDALRDVGEKYGVGFPELRDAREANAYVLRYGREIFLSDG